MWKADRKSNLPDDCRKKQHVIWVGIIMQELVETKANMGSVIEMSTQAYESRSVIYHSTTYQSVQPIIFVIRCM